MPTAPSTQPAHTNRLIDATSPYLLQHAHNPVDWHPWDDEALERARSEDKPIFLSIGYSACHWCHVMERESFENERIAALLNRDFVSIKVDREERPDLDEIYMNATLAYNRGQGGWPMSVFLTPDQKPFFAGTYFPPESRWGRPGFADILEAVAKAWREDRNRVTEAAEGLTRAVGQIAAVAPAPGGVPRAVVGLAVDALAQAFDRSTGGLLSGPNKFPPSMAMSLMLRAYQPTARTDEPRTELLDLVLLTMDHMARGGIYDHLGGGIARYSTDAQWLVPHFEKMLYDQALVAGAALEAFQVTRQPWLADFARGILDYVLADLRSPEGGLYSARDADSEGVEGKFYVWSKQEVLAVLGRETGEVFCSFYDVTDAGNWEGHNILNIQRGRDVVARLHGMTEEDLEATLADARKRLLAVRASRVPPHLDDKVLTSWNGLMIATLARAGRILDDRRYTEAASRAARFVLTSLAADGRLLRTCRQGKAHTPGYLDDYAFFVEALIELYEATFDFRWLDEAARLTDDMTARFWDDRGGAFFFTAHDAEQLIVRSKDTRDGAIPSGNSVALMNLLRLAALLDRDDLRDKAARTVQAFAGSINESPLGYDRFLAGVDFLHATVREVVIVGGPDLPATRALLRVLDETYDPHRVVLLLDPAAPDAAALQERVPLLAGKTLIQDRPAAFVCRQGTCRRPVVEPAELLRELKAD